MRRRTVGLVKEGFDFEPLEPSLDLFTTPLVFEPAHIRCCSIPDGQQQIPDLAFICFRDGGPAVPAKTVIASRAASLHPLPKIVEEESPTTSGVGRIADHVGKLLIGAAARLVDRAHLHRQLHISRGREFERESVAGCHPLQKLSLLEKIEATLQPVLSEPRRPCQSADVNRRPCSIRGPVYRTKKAVDELLEAPALASSELPDDIRLGAHVNEGHRCVGRDEPPDVLPFDDVDGRFDDGDARAGSACDRATIYTTGIARPTTACDRG